MCGNAPYSPVCGDNIYTTQGGPTAALRDLGTLMYNPAYDTANKDATGWWVIVPITECPPFEQGSSWDPKPVISYAKIHIRAVCVTGTTKGCGGADFGTDTTICPSATNNAIIIDKISCLGCPNQFDLSGLKSVLVQ